MKYKIYKLIDPRDNSIKYVGITEKSIYQRLVTHLSEIYTRKRILSFKNNWLKDLIENGKFPLIELLEETDDKTKEIYWIQLLKPELNCVNNNSKALSQIKKDIRSKAIYQYNLKGNFIQKWKSALVVEQTLGIKAENLSHCINGNRKSAGGFLWYSELLKQVPSYKRHRNTVPIYQYTLDWKFVAEYKSMSNIPGFTLKGISKCCNGATQSHRGYRFTKSKI